MRSYIGLYKTLLPSPNLTLLLDSFNKMVADRDSKEPFVWDRKLGQSLVKTTEAVDNLQSYDKWLPCELDALAFATAFTAEYHLIIETKQPVIISPDSKPMADAVKFIKKGSFSTNPRIQSLLTNVNRVPIIVQMASGKSNLNNCADFQCIFLHNRNLLNLLIC